MNREVLGLFDKNHEINQNKFRAMIDTAFQLTTFGFEDLETILLAETLTIRKKTDSEYYVVFNCHPNGLLA